MILKKMICVLAIGMLPGVIYAVPTTSMPVCVPVGDDCVVQTAVGMMAKNICDKREQTGPTAVRRASGTTGTGITQPCKPVTPPSDPAASSN